MIVSAPLAVPRRCWHLFTLPGGFVVSRLSVACVAVAVFALSSTARAQECLGLRSLKFSSANIGMNWRWLEDSRGPEGRLTTGREHGFGGLRAGLLNIGQTNRAFNVGLDAGGTFGLGNSLSMCPLASFNYQPAAGTNSTYPAAREVLFGVSFGARPYTTTMVKLIPYAGIGYLRTSFKDVYFPLQNATQNLTQNGAEISGGVGVQLGEQVVVRAGGRFRDGYGKRSRMLTLGIALAPTRK